MSTKVYGIDVSHHQGTINWQKTASELRRVNGGKNPGFAFLRVGRSNLDGKGGLSLDSQWKNNLAGCEANGVPVGVYWYSYANDRTAAREEARACLAVIRDKQLEYPVWFDQEYNTATKNMTVKQRTDVVKSFCDELENAGYYTGLYCSRNWLTSYVDSTKLKAYDIWVAAYNKTPGKVPLPYGMWQYSSTGTLPGIGTKVDLDIAYKNYPSIIRRAGLNNLR